MTIFSGLTQRRPIGTERPYCSDEALAIRLVLATLIVLAIVGGVLALVVNI